MFIIIKSLIRLEYTTRSLLKSICLLLKFLFYTFIETLENIFFIKGLGYDEAYCFDS